MVMYKSRTSKVKDAVTKSRGRGRRRQVQPKMSASSGTTRLSHANELR